MVQMEEGAVQQQWGSCGFGVVSFIAVVPRKGAALVGVQMKQVTSGGAKVNMKQWKLW